MEVKEIESKEKLAGYLAIHHHNNNLAMTFLNPDKKVRLLLSYVLFGAKQEITRLTQGIYYRSVITQCHLEYEKLKQQYIDGEIDGSEVIRLAELFSKKAELANKHLEEIANATN